MSTTKQAWQRFGNTNRMGGERNLEARLRKAIEDTMGFARKE